MGNESPTLQYRIAQEGYDVLELGVTISPKDRMATVIIGESHTETPLTTTPCLLKRNDSMIGGIEVAVQVDTPFEESLVLPLFYIANYSMFGLPTPDLHPDIAEKSIRPDRTVTRIPDANTIQKAMNAVTILRASLNCQQQARIK